MGKLGFSDERFTKVFYFKHGGTGTGDSADSPLPIATNADLLAIPAGTVVERCYMLLDVAITGSTNIDVGDDDSANGFIDSSTSVTLNTPAMYGYDAKLAGAYLRVQTAGATDAGDIYVVPNAKYYPAAGKELRIAVTGASEAGEFRVVLEGYRHKY